MSSASKLQQAIEAFRAAPPVFATADKRGKFPMAELQKSPDGAHFDTVPLTHACTAAAFDKIKTLIAALVEWQEATTATPSAVSDKGPGTTQNIPETTLETEGETNA